MNIQIEPNKTYKASIQNVESFFSYKFNNQRIEFNFYIEELELETRRTIPIPKHNATSGNNLFANFIKTICKEPLPEELIYKPAMLSRFIFSKAKGRIFGTKLSISKSGEFIDVVDFFRVEEN